jgi:hypothetical protein
VFYEQIFEIALRGRMHGGACIEIGDQFIALMEGRSQPSDRSAPSELFLPTPCPSRPHVEPNRRSTEALKGPYGA